ncbi:MAG: hypothetical protein VKQ33_09200 [Candidatus Sericytochromatia bacterium]|nr:hypothetical protein [Candidatus Sericytochromatia bacterium]
MDATLTTACGRTLSVSVLEVTTRTIYRESDAADAGIHISSFGLQADQAVPAPAVHALTLPGEGARTLNLAVCVALPVGGYFLAGDCVTEVAPSAPDSARAPHPACGPLLPGGEGSELRFHPKGADVFHVLLPRGEGPRQRG